AAFYAAFSPFAWGAAATLAITGSIKADHHLESLTGLVTTPWGRLLLLKLACVGALAGIGAFITYRLAPRLLPSGGRRRSLGQAEAVCLEGRTRRLSLVSAAIGAVILWIVTLL